MVLYTINYLILSDVKCIQIHFLTENECRDRGGGGSEGAGTGYLDKCSEVLNRSISLIMSKTRNDCISLSLQYHYPSLSLSLWPE